MGWPAIVDPMDRIAQVQGGKCRNLCWIGMLGQYPVHAQVEGSDTLRWFGGQRRYRQAAGKECQSQVKQPPAQPTPHPGTDRGREAGFSLWLMEGGLLHVVSQKLGVQVTDSQLVRPSSI